MKSTRAVVAIAILTALLCEQAIAQVSDIFRIDGSTSETYTDYTQVTLAPGERKVLGDLSGPGKATYFYYTDGSNDSGYRRGLVLEVYWDEASKPSIQVPLADFFGAFESHSIDYQSLLTQINHWCHMSYLPMPFAKRARFVLVNDGDQTYSRPFVWGIDFEKNVAFERETSRLHAAWTRSNPVRNGLHPMLQVTGKGVYVGNFLQANTKYEGWWGEGDTLFEVDGKKFAHSLGTEDEYGSTWGFDHTFSYPYSGYVQMENGKNRMYRWYFANPVRFQKSLRVTIQNQRFQGRPEDFKDVVDARRGQVPSQDDYTSVVFWYQEGAHPAPAIAPYAQRIAAGRGATYPSPSTPPEAK